MCSLWHNTIGDQGASAIAKALTVNAVLKSLNLAENCIRAEGATTIAKALRANRILTDLSVRSNGIGHQGATAFAEALEINGILTNLNLANNELCGLNRFTSRGIYTTAGITSMVKVLKINAGLKELK